MPLQPLYDRVLVRSTEKSQTTASGFVIPGQGKPDEGIVVATGVGHIMQDGTIRPLTVQVGDKVRFGERDGHAMIIDGQELLMFQEAQILGIVS